MRSLPVVVFLLTAISTMHGCGEDEGSSPSASNTEITTSQSTGVANAHAGLPGAVSRERALNASGDVENWLLHGRTHDEQRFSPLDQITRRNINRLGVAWALDIPSSDGLVATPIVVDGTIYLSAPFSVIYAVDAASGNLLWSYDPQVKLNLSVFGSWLSRWNRGVTVWNGKVIVGTGDCRLVAVDAGKGTPVWEVETCDSSIGYAITGAPRVGDGKVFIGNAGADWGLRGYVTAYDADSGEFVWRFYTVPRDTVTDREAQDPETTAQTGSGEAGRRDGGGGSVWDSMTYDQELNRLYLGTDSVFPEYINSTDPEEFDDLLTNAIVALDAATGEYLWHYQTVPAGKLDYNAAAHMILADMEIAGESRKVLMQAPKNGFFYVIDRNNGELLSADNYTTVTWASHIDLETGKPVLNTAAPSVDPESGKPLVFPYGWGGHNWHPMSYSLNTGLVYIPVLDVAAVVQQSPASGVEEEPLGQSAYGAGGGKVAEDEMLGKLVAWDPVTQSERWSQEHKLPWNGGVLSTAGGLVFQGNAEGRFNAFAAHDGELLWTMKTGSAIQAPPVTVRINGEQLVIVPVGWGGPQRLWIPRHNALPESRGNSRLIAFKLDGDATLPAQTSHSMPVPEPPQQSGTADVIARGEILYGQTGCVWCHGVDVEGGSGSVPNLRYLTKEKHAAWDAIVLGGAYQHKGMLSYKDALSAEDSAAIHAYVIDRAWKAYNEQSTQ